jgi:hypothetical protein
MYDNRPPSKRNLTGLEELAVLLGPVVDVPPLCPTCNEPFGDGECAACGEERIRKNQPDGRTKAALARGTQDIDQRFRSVP